MAPRPASVSQIDVKRVLRAFQSVGQKVRVEMRGGTTVFVPIDGVPKVAEDEHDDEDEDEEIEL